MSNSYDCSTCGAMVLEASEELHDEWHRRNRASRTPRKGNGMNITNQAVEAAAKTHQDLPPRGVGQPRWDDLPPSSKAWRLAYMRAALEAAAPYLREGTA